MQRFHALTVMSAIFLFAGALSIVSCGGDDDDDASEPDDDTDDDAGEEVWTDPDTGLGWQNGEDVGAENMSPDDAAAYCDGLAWAGFDDWRLPTISELRGLVRGCADTATGGSCQVRDDCASSPCWTILCEGCSEAGGPGTDGAYGPEELTGNPGAYWSSTAVSDTEEAIWSMDSALGGIPALSEADNRARCVRGAGSGLADETGKAYRVAVVLWIGSVTPVNPPVAVQGGHCELLDLDGVPVDEPISVISDQYGWCTFVFSAPFETYSVKITASGFMDSTMYNFHRFERDAEGLDWGWINSLVTQEVGADILDNVGLVQDTTKGQVFGTSQWLPTVPIPGVGGTEYVGCAEITPDVDGFYYTDGAGLITDGLTETSPTSAAWYAFNQDPGLMEFTATADDASASTGEFEVFANTWTIVMTAFTEADYPANPTPDDCE